MPSITASVRHRLPVREVRRRIAAWLARGGPGGLLRSLRGRWHGSHLQLDIVVGRTRIAGLIEITETNVTATADLPWQLLPFASAANDQMVNQLRELLDG